MNRPSKKELFNKIREAGRAITEGRIEIIDAVAIASDAVELDYDVETELSEILQHVISEATPEHYKGSRPPQMSYKPQINGLELFAFVVEPACFNCAVYIKFALTQDAFWLVSLHKDRPKKEEK